MFSLNRLSFHPLFFAFFFGTFSQTVCRVWCCCCMCSEREKGDGNRRKRITSCPEDIFTSFAVQLLFFFFFFSFCWGFSHKTTQKLGWGAEADLQLAWKVSCCVPSLSLVSLSSHHIHLFDYRKIDVMKQVRPITDTSWLDFFWLFQSLSLCAVCYLRRCLLFYVVSLCFATLFFFGFIWCCCGTMGFGLHSHE